MPPAPPEAMPESSNATNVGLVARREYIERVRSRAFVFSTLLLIGLAVVIALIPLGVRLLDRATVTQVGVVADDPALAARAVAVMDGALNAPLPGGDPGSRKFDFEPRTDAVATAQEVRDGVLAGAILIVRKPDKGLDFKVLTGGALSPDRAQLLQIGAFGVGILDWTASQPASTTPFVLPSFSVVDATAASPGGGTGLAVDTAEYASRRIVGIVFVVLSFLTLVFYGLWVASGVVAEKASRVMELLISAATAPQLVIGKISGIGLAGLTQVTLVLLPAVLALVLSGRLAASIFGTADAATPSLGGLSPGLLAAFLVYFVLGFALYAAMYAGAGSLLSRPEDLQIVALPLSIPAIMGYFPAVLALSGGTGPIIRFASYVPLWSPFVMMARLSVGSVEPWEVVLSLGLLVTTVPIVTWFSIRVYRAGVLLYGQPPTMRTFLRAVRG
jgi:ABC-2 type transport system permease protein